MESWLHEDVETESSNPENSDGEEIGNDLESRLYSIIHHNNLNEPLPPELAKHYSLHQSDDGDLTVTLQNSLDDDSLDKMNSDATEVIDIVHISDDEKSDDVVIVSELTKPQYSNKRVRYSDTNIDLIKDTQQNNKNFDTPLDAECDPVKVFSNVKYLQELVLSKKHRSFAYINIPTTIEFSDWKSDSKANFIPIGKRPDKNPKIKFELRKALEKINPGVSHNQLSHLVNIFTRDCAKRLKRVKNKEPQYDKSNTLFNVHSETQNHCINKNKGDNLTHNSKYMNDALAKTDHIEDISINITPSFCFKSPKRKTTETPNKKKINGSVSLNSSPFRPKPKDIEPNVERAVEANNKSNFKNKSHFPSKWSKKMVSFYTKPHKAKMDANIEDILQNLNNTSTREDWQIDPRDATGVYHRPVSKQIHIRCSKCKRRGHLDKNCPEPKIIKGCIFCGGPYHYWCPKGICLKCGVYTNNTECEACYYEGFQNIVCKGCGSSMHRTANCPDSWRRFHATITEGELIIPGDIEMNSQRYCCNCGRKGHFSHKCKAPHHTGQQINPFVTNYSTVSHQDGTTEIFLNRKFEEIIDCPEADEFLQGLSNSSKTHIEMDKVDRGTLLKITGTFDQCKKVKCEIEEFVNSKKRKIADQPMRRKRRKLR